MLKIIVCVKAVPDPQKACEIKIDPKTKNLMRGDIPMVINQLDKNALEEALQLKETVGAKITVVSMGPPSAGNIVKECLALGADKGVLLSDQAFGGADAYATAFTLAKCIQKMGDFDVVLCGMASSDGATEWVGPEMAVFLDVPVVTMVHDILDARSSMWTIKTAHEDGYRLVQVELPAVLTVSRELNHPRALSFSGIIKAKKKEITQWGISDLSLSEDMVGLKGSPTIVTRMTTIESKRQVDILSGSREEKAEQLLQKLVDAGIV